jgi:nucleoside-diphosphate-sugar epimerase
VKILITGASGFVGNRLARGFLDAGHEVVGADLVPFASGIVSQSGFEPIQVDLTDPQSVASLPLGEVDILYHLAAAGVKAHTREWPLCVNVNVLGTLNLVKELANFVGDDCNAPKIVYTKSYYEDHLHELRVFQENPYVVTKRAATGMIEQLSAIYPESIRIAKVFQVFGPDDDEGSALSYAAKTLKAGETAIFGSSNGLRDWIYIDDFIDGLMRCGLCEGTGLLQWDLGSKTAFSLKELVTQIAAICGRPESALVFDPSKDRGDEKLMDRAVNLPPDWKPKWPVYSALEQLVAAISAEDQSL